MSIPKKRKQKGFALIEVMAAIFILAFGLMALAALLAQLSGSTTQSRYLGAEVMLASEKLEDLNQLDYKTYQVGTATPLLAPGGSLAANNAGYSDLVKISAKSGMISDMGNVSAANDMITFQRRWVIESDTPVVRVQRITVIVIPLAGTAVEKAATFQTSTIRPCDVTAGC